MQVDTVGVECNQNPQKSFATIFNDAFPAQNLLHAKI